MEKSLKRIVVLSFYIGIIGCPFFVGCSKDDTNNKEEPVTIDKTPPKISLTGLPEKIEILTELNISVSDESENVTTKIYVDDIEVFSTEKKSFNFTLDPFDYKTGDRNISITSKDKSGNEITNRSTFESKRLLINYPEALRSVDKEVMDSYIAINKMDGELVSFKKIEMDEDGKFYAEDDFERQDFVITQYNIGRENIYFFIDASSYAGIVPGTVFKSKEEQQFLVNNYPIAKLEKPYLQSDLLISSPSEPVMYNQDSYIFRKFGSSNDSFTLSYAPKVDVNFFMYYFPNDGNIETDYKYLFITDLDKHNYVSDDFVALKKTSNITIPSGNAYTFVLNGYEDEDTYDKYMYRKMYEQKDSAADNLSIQVPLVDDFKVYQKRLDLKIDDNKSIGIQQKGLGPFVIPDMDIIPNDNVLELKGDYDYSLMKFHKTLPNNPNDGLFEWEYFNKPTATAKIPFYSFELPDPVQEIVLEKSIEITPDGLNPNYLICSLTDYSEEVLLEDLAFGAYYISNRGGDYVSMTLEITP